MSDESDFGKRQVWPVQFRDCDVADNRFKTTTHNDKGRRNRTKALTSMPVICPPAGEGVYSWSYPTINPALAQTPTLFNNSLAMLELSNLIMVSSAVPKLRRFILPYQTMRSSMIANF